MNIGRTSYINATLISAKRTTPAAFQGMGKISVLFLGDVAENLVNLNDTDGVRCQGDIEMCLGAAVRAMGVSLRKRSGNEALC